MQFIYLDEESKNVHEQFEFKLKNLFLNKIQ